MGSHGFSLDQSEVDSQIVYLKIPYEMVFESEEAGPYTVVMTAEELVLLRETIS